MENAPKNILVFKNRAMGDSLMGLSTVSYLKSIFPKAKVSYATPAWVAPLYDKVQTEVDEIIPIDLKSIKGIYQFKKIMFKRKFDFVLELNQAGSSAKLFSLLKIFLGFRYFFHNHHQSEGEVLDQGKIKPNIQRDLDAAWSAFKLGEVPSFLTYPPKITVQCEKVKKIIFGVVATRETKMWPLEYYSQLANVLEDYEIIIPLSNSKKDLAIKNSLKVASNCTFIFSPLCDLPHKLADATLYIGNDTGLKHLCAALGMKTLTFFGPEEPLEWHPYDESSHKFFYQDGLECRTQISHYCPLNKCDSMICLNKFTVQDVVNKISAEKFL